MGDISKDIKSKFPNNRVRALINIIYTANWISNRQNNFFKPFGISPQQYNILRILRGAGEALKVQVIKERMIERAPNATRLMDKLCEKELIDRLACPDDRRVVHIKINKKGLALLKEIDSIDDVDFMSRVSNQEAKILSDLLDKIRD